LYRRFQWCKYKTFFYFGKTIDAQILTKLNNKLKISLIIFSGKIMRMIKPNKKTCSDKGAR